MLPISQSLMLSHSQLDIWNSKNSYSSQVSNTFVLFKKDQILEELVARRGAPAVHGQASAAEETLSSSTGGESLVQLDEGVLQLWPGRDATGVV